ncbi:4-hydroxythreonine-4-phosphate dehydrogenase [Syntrophotalea carbinolica DSM 2380]|uniref:4-hydroxythreonine-4-phosphate dehydrogenase n=1 Tax=Syntrophotalea carbinolica (strain DSM 2380 / NBRC 103641 / GraBd1) TaxID=338963 RepID=Q3A8E1_SYNC1|nr:4-hydroxythreonine-4-phosphate dehydrogenase PdxA [Syntrophotalea carbinolica]ABA87351.1 4-hydroxythreonine-4-phosphate dehydrogenase [Syntrophotalea carbinolica DSM 2380]
MHKPLILTMGDPTGVGPEVILKAWLSGALDGVKRPLLVAGDTAVLQRAAHLLQADCTTGEIADGLATHMLQAGNRRLAVRSLSNLPAPQLSWGHPDAHCGKAMLDYINWACDQCLKGTAAAMVTGPINKQAILAAGCDAPGHTELLARRCRTDKVVMMLGGAHLKVCLVTTHLPLKEVPDTLTTEDIVATIRITDSAFRRFFGCRNPRLAVLALNPHAGEGGRFGDEEERIIAPAIAAARQCGINASGPHSADALFHFAARGDYDAVVCMYHDQGLIPLKLLHFEDGVNVTLGLPIIRTSVDHGTAYDLAGTGKADCSSLVAAVTMAAQMAEKQ